MGLPVKYPTLKEQIEIVTKVEALFAKADAIDSFFVILKEKIEWLPQALLAKAFRGELVPQDPNNEPASVLLEKIIAAKSDMAKPAKAKKVRGGKQAELAV